MNAIPFDAANIPGPVAYTGRVAPPRTIGSAIASAKRPLLIVGSEVTRDGVMERAIEIGKKGIPITATAHSIKSFVEKGYDDAKYFWMHNLTACLLDTEWKGLDDKGSYDLVIFMGMNYYFASQMMSAIKNFATEPLMNVVSIDRYYHPNARMSLGHIRDDEEYLKMLDEVIAQL